jgi:antitoxin component YwqK of YwqJK toxin-antitoxin module
MLTEIKSKTEHYFVDEQNRRQGVYKRFHDNGLMAQHSELLNGKNHGRSFAYYCNGKPFSYIEYDTDRFHGEYTWYDNNGEVIRSTWYHYDWNMHIDPKSLTEKDKLYIKMSGRMPPRYSLC